MLKRLILFSSLLLAATLTLLYAEREGILFLAKLTIATTVVAPILAYILDKTIGLKKCKAPLFNLMLFCISVTFSLVVAELFVRAIYNDVTTTGDNSSYFARRWKHTHQHSINNLGFRERKIIKEKPDNVYRIAVVGDSFTYGQGIKKDVRFTNIIEHRLNNSITNTKYSFEVLNFGKPGAETIDHISFLDPVLELSPNLILLQWFSNDVEDHYASARPRPYRIVPSDFISGLLHRNSALYYMVNSKWTALQYRNGLIETYEDSMLRRFGDPESMDSRRAKRELDEFIQRVKDKGIPLGIMMFPNLVEVSGSVDNYPYGFLFDRVINACQRHDIQCLDLRPVFSHISPASKLWVNQFDPHPGSLANEMTAEAILDKLNKTWINGLTH